ncbi:MAG TPA: hypothetical protein VMZ91_08655 [Candidatus Paceibacterota bacterium]|nr:hypothetical protein [Candidatus Paceibacterota bacterium]
MNDIEQLKKERDRLKSQREVKQSMRARNIERKQLKSEIRKEKYHGLYSFGSSLGRASAKATEAAVRYAKKKSAAPKRKIIKTSRRVSVSKKTPRQPQNLSQALYGY